MPGGRPLALTPEKVQLVINALRQRNVLEAAAAIADVKRSTLYDAMRRGREVSVALDEGARRRDFTRNDLRLAEFSDACRRAIAMAEVETVALIGKAGTQPSVETTTKRRYVGRDDRGGLIYATETTTIERPPDWKALGWVAERRWHDWAPRQRTELSGPEGGPIPVEQRVGLLLSRVEELREGEGPRVIDVEAVEQ